MLGNPRTWFGAAFIAFVLGVIMVCSSGGDGRGERWVGEDPDSGTYDPATSQPNDGSTWWEGGSGTSDNGWWGDSGSWDSGSDSGSWDSGGSDSGSWDSGGSDSGSWDSGGSDGGTWDDGGSDSGSW